uniref:(E3-independent) E2 ubiquitin-conjugating enzyme n=1 Tax=Cyclopterus lumpus TaxID=8103 RepID=A0A8C3B1L2_CYCLU
MAEPVASEAATTDAAASPTPSPLASPVSEPLSMALSPTADGSQRLLFSHDLVSGRYRSTVRFGLVRMIHGEEDFNSDSDLDDGGGGGVDGGGRVPCGSDTESAVDTPSRPLCQGFVRVQWYPEGGKQDIKETKLKLEDRCIVIRDIVRRNNSNDNQCGIVTNIDIECAVKLVGTNCVLYPVNGKDLQYIWSFMYGDYIAFDFWLGKVYDLTNHIILKLSNGARCSMSVEDGAKLYDVCPHVSDSGLFFDEAYGFYPGQVLIGPAKVFSNVQWLSGVKPVLSRKCKFRVVVEEVKVVELKVTWITKSYSPNGSEGVCPPASTITQEHLSRVRRLGYYDHTQRQLAERALYVFPAKGDATCITCEGPEGAPVLPEDPVARKVRMKCIYLLLHSLTSSASSTASSQSGGLGVNRKKSVPLSIRNLKRKHKKKRTKFSREFMPGDRVAVEVVSTKTTANVMWKDGRVETGIRSNDLIPIQHLDSHEFCPGDFVVDKRPQALQDPGVYGVIQSGDHKGRTCVVKWIKLNSTSDDVEVFGMEEDVSVYDIADHPDFHFRTTDIVIRIWNSEIERRDCETETSVGQVSRVDVSSKVEVVWADNSMTIVLPQHLYNVESEIEETYYDSVEETSSVLSTEEWEDESDSWETDNGLTTEDDSHVNNADVVEPSTPTPTGSAVPIKGTPGEEGEASVAAARAVNGAEKPSKDGASRGFKELKEALKILESLKNMTVEQLWTGGSPTSPTSAEPKPTKEKRFLDEIKKLQENLRKTLDNVAIVEEEKMEAVVEVERAGEEKPQQEPLTPLGGQEWPSEFLSDTPVLCQRSGGKPGVTFTSARGEVFSVLEWAPDTQSFKKMEFQPAEAKKFFSTVRKEMALLATSLPDGIMVKTFEDRMDLFSSLIKGPTRTPYEDGLFLFDIQLPNIYPSVPPLFRYLSQCSGRLNPNLYDNGKVCVSLLGTWIGKGNERWTSKSSLLQVLISIQGLILVNEPYYNEAGFDSDRGLQEGYENSRCYNEMALIKMVQSMTLLLQHPVEVFKQEIQEHFVSNGWRLVHRLDAWLELNDGAERAQASHTSSREGVTGAGVTSIMEEELEDSGLSPSTTAASQPDGASESGSVVVSGGATGSQPVVRPKKRRKSYRSFLPEGSGYPDIGFPLFPLSKGFVKSIRGVLLQYRAALAAAAIPQHTEDK